MHRAKILGSGHLLEREANAQVKMRAQTIACDVEEKRKSPLRSTGFPCHLLPIPSRVKMYFIGLTPSAP